MSDPADPAQRVRQVVLDRARAVLDLDVRRATAVIGDDIVTFDVLPPKP